MYELKTKDCARLWLSNLNLGIFVCSFDVCRASKPFPSINYDTTQLSPFWFWVTLTTGNPVYGHGASSSIYIELCYIIASLDPFRHVLKYALICPVVV